MAIAKNNILPLLVLLICINQSFGQTNSEDELISKYNKALNLEANGNLKGALSLVTEILEEEPDVEIFIKKHLLEFDLQAYQASYNTLNHAIEVFPKESSLYNYSGIFLQAVGEYDAAIEEYERAYKYEKNDTLKMALLSNMATVKLNIRDFQGAYDDFIECYKFDTTSVSTLTNLGAVCDEIGKGDETLFYLLKAADIDSLAPGVLGNIGFKYQHDGNHKKAIEYFSKEIRNSEEGVSHGVTYNNIGFSKLKLGDTKGALKSINKAIKLYPGNSYAYRNRALVYIEQKKIESACMDLEEAILLDFTTNYGDEVLELQEQHCNSKK